MDGYQDINWDSLSGQSALPLDLDYTAKHLGALQTCFSQRVKDPLDQEDLSWVPPPY